MHPACYFDGRVVTLGPSLNALSSAALYGKGIFTTLSIHRGKPFLWEKHWRRLVDNAFRLKIDLAALSHRSILDALDAVIEQNSLGNGRARITIFDQSYSSLWPYPGKKKSSLLITTGDARARPEQARLAVSPYHIISTSPLAGIKSCNYLDKLMAHEEAKARGFDEAVRVNERGEITSACMANIFWLKNEELFTPTLETGCLAGTTREFVIENVPCEERAAPIEDLLTADSVFLTSAGLGIASVSEIDGKKFQISDHQISKLIPGYSD